MEKKKNLKFSTNEIATLNLFLIYLIYEIQQKLLISSTCKRFENVLYRLQRVDTSLPLLFRKRLVDKVNDGKSHYAINKRLEKMACYYNDYFLCVFEIIAVIYPTCDALIK
jgi:hypothetical protein